MKNEYVLYLDESESKRSKTFAIAGIAVKKDHISVLDTGMREVKKLIWTEEYLRNNNPVLHCTELQKIYSGRNQNTIAGVRDEYKELIGKSSLEIERLYIQIYGKLSQILKNAEATVFSCVIKLQQLYDLYYIDETHDGTHLIDDKYNIALQKIIENYTHYLSVNDGVGDVIYESRNSIGENSFKSPDIKLINDYHKIQANNKGIVYTDSIAIQSRNRTIVTYSKSKNLAGLTIADFVAYNIIKYEKCNVKQQLTDFMKQIHKLSYNGGHTIAEKDQRSFWGLRVLPSYLYMSELVSSNKQLKNANHNLKKERNKLKKNIDKMQKKISDLENQIEELQLSVKKFKPQ